MSTDIRSAVMTEAQAQDAERRQSRMRFSEDGGSLTGFEIPPEFSSEQHAPAPSSVPPSKDLA